MRYIIAETNGETQVAIWAKSQLRDESGNECSHREYLRRNNIPFEDVISMGYTHINSVTGEVKVDPLPWDGPKVAAPNEQLMKKKTVEFWDKYHGEIKNEIDADWTAYQEYLARQRAFLASQR